MEIKSTDMKADEAVDAIRELTDRDAIVLFITGDERKTVIHAAEERIREVTGEKQGGQDGDITEKTADFKDGVQAVKGHVTCEDVIKKMRKEGKRI